MSWDLRVGNLSSTNTTRSKDRGGGGSWGWVDGWLSTSAVDPAKRDETMRLIEELNRGRPGTPDGGF